MKHTALILSGDARFSRFLVTELGYLGVPAVIASAPEILSHTDGDISHDLLSAAEYRLLIADGDTCSEAVQRWLFCNVPCPLLLFAHDELSCPPSVGAGYDSLFLRRPFLITDLDGAVRTLLSLDPEGSRPLPLSPAIPSGIRDKQDAVSVTQDGTTATVQGHSVPLTATESAILACLLSHRGELVPRDALAPMVGSGNSVDVYVCHLRRKLEKPLGIRLIHTVRGQGYRLV
jgi:DNA-binding response OmpR family regulator